ncbi:MAG: SLBB domain-containing protein [Armatimonadetes bacterium]|nr:SLBB domain-containing protein [Armatimonadota bacterium]
MNTLRFGSVLLSALLSAFAWSDDYLLKEGDSVSVRYVLGAERLVATGPTEIDLEIPPGGTLTLPYVGAIQAAGVSVADLESLIGGKLRKRFPKAECFVILTRIRPAFFSIIGEVEEGGQYALPPNFTLREALALSGGPLRRPELLQASIFRDGRLHREFDLYNVSATDNPAGREVIRPGDVISIQTKRQIRVWTTGLSAAPGERTVEQGTGIRELVAETAAVEDERREQIFVSVVRDGREVYRHSVFDIDASRAPSMELSDGDFITLAPLESVRVWVFGAVASPGQYDVPAGSNVLQALAMAGGVTQDGSLRNVRILRGAVELRIDLRNGAQVPELEDADGDGVEQRWRTEAGDIIVVAENTRRVAVLGEVASPGVYFIQDEIDPTLSDVIGMAGGFTKRGPANRVAIIRVMPGGEVKRIPVDFSRYLKRGDEGFNPPIMPGDVVMVGETPRIEISAVVNALIGLFGLRTLIR